MKLNKFQKLILTTMSTMKYHVIDARVLAVIVSSSQVAVSSSLRCMQIHELVGYVPPKDKWDCKHWFLTDEGRLVITT
jgi:ATP-dependent helicase/DNAse subunit B